MEIDGERNTHSGDFIEDVGPINLYRELGIFQIFQSTSHEQKPTYEVLIHIV